MTRKSTLPRSAGRRASGAIPLRALPLVLAAAAIASPAAAQCAATLSQPRGDLAAASVGTKALFAGGCTDLFQCVCAQTSAVVDVYDAATDTWSTASLSQPRGRLAATTVGTRVLFAGGEPVSGLQSAVVDVYDDATGSWSTTALSTPRAGLAATTVGNVAIFAGGENAAGYSDRVDLFDATTGTWSTASLSVARTDLAATSVGGKAYFAGGRAGVALSTVDVYDLAAGTWSVTNLSAPRYGLAAVTVNQRAVFAGGGPSNVVDVLDAATGVWSTRGVTPGSAYIAGTVLGDRALFAGGCASLLVCTCGGEGTKSVLIYDATLDEAWPGPALDASRARLAAASVPGKAIFAGGGGGPVDVVEFYLDGFPSVFCDADPPALCPCGNPGAPGTGCASSTGAGAALRGLVGRCVESTSLALVGLDLPPGTPGLLFVGTGVVQGGLGLPYGDGLRCVGGSVVRLGIEHADALGGATWGPDLSSLGGWAAGDTRHFQVMYLDPAGPCGTGRNTTNGVTVTFGP